MTSRCLFYVELPLVGRFHLPFSTHWGENLKEYNDTFWLKRVYFYDYDYLYDL